MAESMDVKALQKDNARLKKLNKNLQDKLGMGNGRFKVEEVKAGILIRPRKPFNEAIYSKLHEMRYTQVEIAKAMGISLSTLQRRLKEKREAIFIRDQSEEEIDGGVIKTFRVYWFKDVKYGYAPGLSEEEKKDMMAEDEKEKKMYSELESEGIFRFEESEIHEDNDGPFVITDNVICVMLRDKKNNNIMFYEFYEYDYSDKIKSVKTAEDIISYVDKEFGNDVWIRMCYDMAYESNQIHLISKLPTCFPDFATHEMGFLGVSNDMTDREIIDILKINNGQLVSLIS